MTGNMNAPVEVDPTAPELPASALVGLSFYFALSTGSPTVSIFDLRAGKKVALGAQASPPAGAIVAGHFAAWSADNGDVYLADLESGQVQKVLSLQTGTYGQPAVALGDKWLVALQLLPAAGSTSSMTAPSDHPGAGLVALHLPDLRRVDIPAVLAKGEVGSVQVSGDTVLLTVSPAVEPIPHNEPSWTALRILRLQ